MAPRSSSEFSHYDGFDQDVFFKFCLRILDKTSGLGDWLYYANRPLEPRLADRTLSTYLAERGTALVVCDGSYLFPPSPSPSPPSTAPDHQYPLHRLCRIFAIDRRRRDPQRLRSDLMSICPAKLLPIQLAPGDRLTNLYNL